MKRKNSTKACVNCQKTKRKCNDQRPCENCIKRGLECKDIENKTRKNLRPTKNIEKIESDQLIKSSNAISHPIKKPQVEKKVNPLKVPPLKNFVNKQPQQKPGLYKNNYDPQIDKMKSFFEDLQTIRPIVIDQNQFKESNNNNNKQIINKFEAPISPISNMVVPPSLYDVKKSNNHQITNNINEGENNNHSNIIYTANNNIYPFNNCGIHINSNMIKNENICNNNMATINNNITNNNNNNTFFESPYENQIKMNLDSKLLYPIDHNRKTISQDNIIYENNRMNTKENKLYINHNMNDNIHYNFAENNINTSNSSTSYSNSGGNGRNNHNEEINFKEEYYKMKKDYDEMKEKMNKMEMENNIIKNDIKEKNFFYEKYQSQLPINIPQILIPLFSIKNDSMYCVISFQGIHSDKDFHSDHMRLEDISKNYCDYYGLEPQDILHKYINDYVCIIPSTSKELFSIDLLSKCKKKINYLKIVSHTKSTATNQHFRNEAYWIVCCNDQNKPHMIFSFIQDITPISDFDFSSLPLLDLI